MPEPGREREEGEVREGGETVNERVERAQSERQRGRRLTNLVVLLRVDRRALKKRDNEKLRKRLNVVGRETKREGRRKGKVSSTQTPSFFDFD